MVISKIIFFTNLIIKRIIRKLFSIFISPLECIGCGQKCYELPICKQCQDKLKIITSIDKRCKICGKELLSEINICSDCKNERVLKNTDCVIPLYSYHLWKKDLLFNWKINDVRSLSDFFADKISNTLNQYFKNLPIVPVPPRSGKNKKKGWDQISELTKFLKFKYNFEVLNLLERINDQQQKTLNRVQRLEHIEKSYILKNNIKELPDEVVLIDDITTTGSTLESCAAVLKNAGVKKVNCITLFIAE